MPEGPEVYTTTSDLSKLFQVKQIISDITIVGGRYHHSSPSYFKNGEPNNWSCLIDKLPLTVVGVYCKGKMMWYEFKETNMVLVSRFGMSGYYGYRKENEKSPKHTAVDFTLSDNSVVYYNDVRRFGIFTILLQGIDSELAKLGPVFIEPPKKHSKISKMRKKEFVNIIMNRPGPLARELMKQNIVSGIGNYILSECLYDTSLHPLIKCKDLTKKQAQNLYRNIRKIMKRSIKYKGVSIRNYKPLTQGDNEKCGGSAQYHLKVYRQIEDPEGNPVKVIKKGPHGRAIHWCPVIQVE